MYDAGFKKIWNTVRPHASSFTLINARVLTIDVHNIYVVPLSFANPYCMGLNNITSLLSLPRLRI